MSDLDKPETPPFFERSGADPRPPTMSESGEIMKPEVSREEAMIDHLAELRNRIIIALAALAVAFLFSFWAARPVMNALKTLAPVETIFVQLTPGEVLLSSLRLALYMAVALASPVILYHLLRFTLPGLLPREKPMLVGAVLGGALLFVLGVLFAWTLVIPSALGYLLGYGQSVAVTQISISNYIGFCASLLLITGGLFELPMLLFLLSFTGVVSSSKLLANWRLAIVTVAVIAAVVTPSQDPITMGMVMLAMLALYALSIIPIKLVGR